MSRICIIVILSVVSGPAALAQGLQAVQPLPGYICMELALKDDQFTDPNVGVPIREAPSRSSPVLSLAATVVIVRSPQQPTAGFLQILRPTGQTGWIETGYLRPWHNPYSPNAQCVPSMMSNGKPGFSVRR